MYCAYIHCDCRRVPHNIRGVPPRPGAITVPVPLVWLGLSRVAVTLVSVGANEMMMQGEFVATQYHACSYGCHSHLSPEGTLRLVDGEGERTGQTGRFASVKGGLYS